MDYDKHCNLQMILYDDGREEIRKPGRKLIGAMKKEEIKDRVRPWIAESQSWAFSAVDLIEPKTLTVMCYAIAALGRNLAEASHHNTNDGDMRAVVGRTKLFKSLSRLMTDLGEAIVSPGLLASVPVEPHFRVRALIG
ncbi:hypothetical protein MY3296_009330 [Beauveria thailandica]